jgi:hypothetical protein
MKTLTKAILVAGCIGLLAGCGEDDDATPGQTSPMTTGDREQTAAPGPGPMEGREQSTRPGGPTTEPPGQAIPGPRIQTPQQQ